MKSDIVDRLFAKYYNDALLYTLSLSKDYILAEDIVSTAFYKALETADDSVQNFKYWLLKVCRNTFYSHLRHSKRHRELSDNLDDGKDGILDKIIKNEEYQALYRAIELLNEAQREVITLFYYENMKIEAIAELIQKSVSNVKVILMRAREALKKILED